MWHYTSTVPLLPNPLRTMSHNGLQICTRLISLQTTLIMLLPFSNSFKAFLILKSILPKPSLFQLFYSPLLQTEGFKQVEEMIKISSRTLFHTDADATILRCLMRREHFLHHSLFHSTFPEQPLCVKCYDRFCDTKINKTQSFALRACRSGIIQISCHKCLFCCCFQEIFLNFAKISFSIFYLRQ